VKEGVVNHAFGSIGQQPGATNFKNNPVNKTHSTFPYQVTHAEFSGSQSNLEVVALMKSCYVVTSAKTAGTSGQQLIFNGFVIGTPTPDITVCTGAGLNSTTQAGGVFNGRSRQVPIRILFDTPCTFVSGDTFQVISTLGFKDNQQVTLNDGTNSEVVTVVAGSQTPTDFDVTARSLVVDANVTTVGFHGLHSVKTQGTNIQVETHGMAYEPFTIADSNALQRLEPKFDKETRVVEYIDLESRTENLPFVIGGVAEYSYPTHTDGTLGTFATSEVSVVKVEDSTVAWNILPNLFTTITPNDKKINIRIISTKNVQKGIKAIL